VGKHVGGKKPTRKIEGGKKMKTTGVNIQRKKRRRFRGLLAKQVQGGWDGCHANGLQTNNRTSQR